MKMTSEEIAKLPRKSMSIKQFIEHAGRFGAKIPEENISRLQNGEFLGVWINESGKAHRLHLKTIWIKPYTLSYRNTKTKNGKAREGREILISNFKLPRGSVVLDKITK